MIFRCLILTWTHSIVNLLFTFYTDRVLWTFDYLGSNFIGARFRNIIFLFFTYSFSNSNAFTSVFFYFIFTGSYSLFYSLFSFFTNWIGWSFFYFWLNFISSRFWNVISLFFINSLSYGHPFLSFFFNLIIPRSNTLFNFLLSFLKDWIFWSFLDCRLYFICSWLRDVVNLLFFRFLSYCYTLPSIFFNFIFTWSNSLLNSLSTLFADWISWTFKNFTLNIVITRFRNNIRLSLF